MVVLSGVGAKEYYQSEFGYSPRGEYMVKNLQAQPGESSDSLRSSLR